MVKGQFITDGYSLTLPDQFAEHKSMSAPLISYYQLLGVPLAFVTNFSTLAEMAAECFLPPGAARDPTGVPLLHLYCFLAETPGAPKDQSSVTGYQSSVSSDQARELPRWSRRNGCFRLAVAESYAFADRSQDLGVALVTPDLLQDRAFVQVDILECLGLYLAASYRRAVLHAAGLYYKGRGILLTGVSGAGKSTLAYACLKAGFRLLSEDVVYAGSPGNLEAPLAALQGMDTRSHFHTLTPPHPHTPLEVWGHPRHLHLLPDAGRLFPELAGETPVRLLSGETKLRLSVNQIQPGAAIEKMLVWGTLTLSRTPGADSRLCQPDLDLFRKSLGCFKKGPELDRAAISAASERLLEGHIGHLEVGADLDQAVELVQDWLEETEDQ